MSGHKPTRQVNDPKGPVEGDIRVLAMTTAASAQQDASEFAGRLVIMIAPVAFYITWGDTVTDPDETQTTGGARTGLVPAYTYHFHRPVEASTDNFKVKGTANANIRWWPANGAG